MQPLCFPSHFFYSLIRNLFQTAKNIVFTGKCCMCLSSHLFLFPNSQLIPTCAKHCVFTGRCACLSRPIFSYSLIHDLFVWRGPANGFCNLNSMRQLLIKNRKYFSLKKKQHVTNDIIHWQGHVKRISRELGNRKKWDERDMHIYLWKHNVLRMLEVVNNINVHAADLLPNCAKHWLFTSKCLLSVSRPIFSIP